jgi:uncharacterized membrane protein YcaP (DUF421 family)
MGVVTSGAPAIDRVLEPQPRLIVSDGKLVSAGLSDELSIDDVFSALRLEGIQDLGQIWRAYIEPSGRVSVFRTDTPTNTHSLLPEVGGGTPLPGGPPSPAR